MGRKTRRVRHHVERMPFAARPFEGLPDEREWIALRNFVERGRAAVTLRDGRQISIVSQLPGGAAASVKEDGEIQVAIQVAHDFGDLSRDLAHAIALAFDHEPGSLVSMTDPGVGERMQDIVDPDSTFEIELLEDFDFWKPSDPEVEVSVDLDTSMLEAKTLSHPSWRIRPHAYITQYGSFESYLRWFLVEDENAVLTALARLRLAATDRVGGRQLLGTFKADGLPVLVWEVDRFDDHEKLAKHVANVEEALTEALGRGDEPLTQAERSARQSLLSRQVIVR
ncbi:hypothetical protein BHE97_01910 [Aeromicrobium sp. PE09-221]|nr:hypothetical protein BHE97_01910 [Aeromicrobium sp. PE09-221]